MGLYLCRELVEAHGGRIWLESTEGQGSTFFVALPLTSQAAPTDL
ncbi:MAG TPA: ATP-binding protein [Ktedonobacteraceae bacterium]|nr:ATP-binding protein [Ktedonobacteraceae bacterium]